MKEGGAEKATLAGLLCQEEGHLQCYQEVLQPSHLSVRCGGHQDSVELTVFTSL